MGHILEVGQNISCLVHLASC